MEINKYLLATILIVVVAAGGTILFIGSQKGKKTKQLSSTQQVSQASAQINTKTLEVGQKAPEFSVSNIDGRSIKLSDLEGKILVMTSGAAWCSTCVIENKNFQPVYEEVKDKGVEFMTVDIDVLDTEGMIRSFQEKYAPWNNIHLSQARQLIDDYGYWHFEITYIIDGDGIVQFVDTGITSTKTLREELDKLI